MNHGKASKWFCMTAACYIAIVPETIWSSIFWAIYTAGAVLGIIHLRKMNDKDTIQMYVIWLCLDIFAMTRLLLWEFCRIEIIPWSLMFPGVFS